MASNDPQYNPEYDALAQVTKSGFISETIAYLRPIFRVIREWVDALIFAFILAMFIRTFVVELFKIPSGSMSPTLLGDLVAEGPAVDANGNTGQFLLIASSNGSDRVQVFRRDETTHYRNEGRTFMSLLTGSQRDLLRSSAHREEHRILVNKFAYWFKRPERGDIIIFRVPFGEVPDSYTRDNHPFTVPKYNPDMAVYVKRCVANDGERVSIGPDGHLLINGAPVQEPSLMRDVLRYKPEPIGAPLDMSVPKNELFAFGDNTDNSLDSRFWDGVPYLNLRGKAFFRYAPVSKFGFLK